MEINMSHAADGVTRAELEHIIRSASGKRTRKNYDKIVYRTGGHIAPARSKKEKLERQKKVQYLHRLNRE